MATDIQQKLLLNVDWLGVSVAFSAPDLWLPPAGNHYFIDYDGTNVWKNRRILFNEFDEKVATILYNPKSSVIRKDAGLIEVANRWLYDGASPYRILDIINGSCRFFLTGLSRADLCVDFTPTDDQLQTIIDLNADRKYVQGKQNGSGFWTTMPRWNTEDPYLCKHHLTHPRYSGMRIPKDQNWGHKTTDVKWKLYYKSKELADAMGGRCYDKPYIIDAWKQAALDVKDVWRLEVSIKHCNRLHFQGVPITLDTIKHHPLPLFHALYHDRFTIRENQGHRDKSNDKLVEFLPIGMHSGISCAPPKASGHRDGQITLLRHLIQALDEPAVFMNDTARENALWHLTQIVEGDGLLRYFKAMTGDDVYTFIEATRVKADYARQRGEIPTRRQLNDDILPNLAAFPLDDPAPDTP